MVCMQLAPSGSHRVPMLCRHRCSPVQMQTIAMATLPCAVLLGFLCATTALLLATASQTLPEQTFSGQIVLWSEIVQLLAAVLVACTKAIAMPKAASSVAATDKAASLPTTTGHHGLDRVHPPTQKRGFLCAVFLCGVPAACQCVAMNVSFLAIRHVPAYVYVLMQGLVGPVTGLLAAIAVGAPLSAQQQLGLLLSLLGVVVGIPPSWYAAARSRTSQTPAVGLLLMLVVVGSVAVARVFAKWMQAHSCNAPEQLQRIWLHLAGVLLNGSVYVMQTKSSSVPQAGGGLVDHMQPLHWGIVAALSVLGCVGCAALIAGSRALYDIAWAESVLLVTAASPWLLTQWAPPHYYAAVAVMAAALYLSSKHAHPLMMRPVAEAAADASLPTQQGSVENDQDAHDMLEPKTCPCCSEEPLQHLYWSWLSLEAAVAVILVLAVATPQGPSHLLIGAPAKPLRLVMAAHVHPIDSSMPHVIRSRHPHTQRTSLLHAHDLNTTHGRHAYLSDPGVLPYSIPVNTSLVFPDLALDIYTSGLRYVCPVLNCSQAANCTFKDRKCCMYFMRRVWHFLVTFAAAHGMESEYFAVFGSVVGALREKGGMVPWTEDVDIAVSSRMVNLLESTAVRQKLWQFGFYFFHDRVWRMCAHGHHPDPVLRAAMSTPRMCPTRAPCKVGTDLPPGHPGRHTGPLSWYDEHLPAVYVDVYSAAPAAVATEGWLTCGDACQKVPADTSLPVAKHLWRVCMSPGWVVVSFNRTADIDGVRIVIPDNAEEHVAVEFGDDWRVPAPHNHGRGLENVTGCPRHGIFAGGPDVGKAP